MRAVVVILAIVVVVAVVAWMFLGRRRPERAARAHGERITVEERPADAAAEDQRADVGDAGTDRPGPPG
jgi:membrane protein implicated in regulation of membrane protease activity